MTPAPRAGTGGGRRAPVAAAALLVAASAALATAAMDPPATPVDPGAASAPAATLRTAPQDTLWALSRRWAGAGADDRARWMVAVRRRNAEAFVDGNLHRLRPGVDLALPSPADVAAEDAALAQRVVGEHRARIAQGTVGPAPLPGVSPSSRRAVDATAGAPVAAVPVPAASPASTDPAAGSSIASSAGSPASDPRSTIDASGPFTAVVAALGLPGLAWLAWLAWRAWRRRRTATPARPVARFPDAAVRGPRRRPAPTPSAPAGLASPAQLGLPPPAASDADTAPLPGLVADGHGDHRLAALRLAVGRAQAELGRTADARRTLEALASTGEAAPAVRDAAHRALAGLEAAPQAR